MKIYISGPITGTDDYRWRFAEAQARLEEDGHKVINPVAVANVLPDLKYDEYMAIDLALLKIADGVYFLKGSGNSNGARIEYQWARCYKKTVMMEEEV